MGRVYSVAEIKSDMVPRDPSAHLAAREELLAAVEEHNRFTMRKKEIEPIHGALVYGSVGVETPNIRSDLDILIAYYDIEVVKALERLFNDLYQKHRVTIEAGVWHEDQLLAGRHTIDPAFKLHLMSMPTAGNLVGQNPVESVHVGPLNSAVLSDYLTRKLRSLTQGFLTYDPKSENQKPLQRALEIPVSVARKFLTVAHGHGLLEERVESTDKQGVVSAFLEFFNDDENVVNLFASLVSRNAEYSDVLDAALLGEITPEQYEEILTGMGKDAILLALRWAREIEIAFERLFNQGD